MKKVLAILGIVFLVSVLYVEQAFFTNDKYNWARQEAPQTFADKLREDYRGNAKLITAWNAFVSFVPNILYTLDGIRIDFQRELSMKNVTWQEMRWDFYKMGFDISNDSAWSEAGNHIKNLSQGYEGLPATVTEEQLLGEGMQLSDKTKEILGRYSKVFSARKYATQMTLKTVSHAKGRSKLWDSLKINPDYGFERKSLFTKFSQFLAHLFVYACIFILLVFCIKLLIEDKRTWKDVFQWMKKTKIYELLGPYFYWSKWRLIVSGVVLLCFGILVWILLSSQNPTIHEQHILPFVGTLWGIIAGVVTYIILLLFSSQTCSLVCKFFRWKYWKWGISGMVAICLFLCLAVSFASDAEFASSNRLLFVMLLLAFGFCIIAGFVIFFVLWIISFSIKKTIFLKDKFCERKKNGELEHEKEKLQNKILSLEVAELKKKLADLEKKQEKQN